MICNPLRLLIATAVGLASWTATASADLLIDPTGGTNISFSDINDGMVTRQLNGSFNFFGAPITKVGVSVNGLLSISSTVNYGADAALSSSTLSNTIDPFYDDLTLFTSGKVSDQTVSGSYYEVTWSGVYDHGYLATGATDTFQAVLFFGNTVVNGYQFLAGDIAISYGSMLGVFNTGTATVGLGSSVSNYVPLAGTTDGQIRNYSLLPTGSNFLLFRPNGSNSYNASTQSLVQPAAVAEPSSWVLLGAGLILATRLRPAPAPRSLATIKVSCP